MFEILIAKTEAFFKGVMFDCRSCGQCLLKRTALICPMSCPKGLRNGPCGGTTYGKCEVYPDKECVWVRIYNKTSHGLDTPELNPSPDANLYFTSSYLNLLSGKDKNTRTPLTYLPIPKNRVDLPVLTESKLEKALKSKKFVFTCEVRSPREADFSVVQKEVEILKEHFDAINATAFLAGRPSVSSIKTAEKLKLWGAEPIAQVTCRDHTKTSFISELLELHESDLHNLLCLTGDSYVGTPKIKQVWDMDSSLMLYEARYLREKGVVHYCNQQMKKNPKPFLGTAINPFTTPVNVPIRRLKQKAAAGADFVQSQLIFDIPAFEDFMGLYHQENLDADLFFLAGVPVVTSKKAFEHMSKIPGIIVPKDVYQKFMDAPNIKEFGIQWARSLIQSLKHFKGIHGVHLMLVGSDHTVLPQVIQNI
jgi:methylenetetrahydrofolate reductase (NADPH)